MLACVGGRREHRDDAFEAGLGTDELNGVRVPPVSELGPLQGQLVERVACIRRIIVLTSEGFVQPRNLLRAMSQHVTVDRIGASQRVDQPGLARANEAHRDLALDPGLVEWRDGADKDPAAALERSEPGSNSKPGERHLHRLIVDPDGLTRSRVSERATPTLSMPSICRNLNCV